MLKRKLRSIAAMTSAVLFINAGICTFATSAEEKVLPADDTDISFNEDIGYAVFVNPPKKTVYKIGEELNLEGATFDSYCPGQGISGNNFDCDLTEYIENGTLTLDASEFDNTKEGKYTIHVNYETSTDSFEVVVIDDETDLPDELTLHCLPYRLDYDLNMELDLTGAIISGSYGEEGECYEFHGEHIIDMIEKGVVEVDASAYNSSEIGTYTIYVKVGTAVESFDVRVGCPLVNNILEIKSLPDKTVYTYGEELDFTGAVLYGWARGDGGFIPDTEFTEDLQTLIDSEKIKVDDSGFYDTKSGICTIYINYEHAWATFEVTVTDEAYEPKEIASGDTNGDGDFTIADMVMVQKHIMGKKSAALSDWKCADFYKDGKVDVYDFIVMRENFVKNMK